jgi:hypothetical protein
MQVFPTEIIYLALAIFCFMSFMIVRPVILEIKAEKKRAKKYKYPKAYRVHKNRVQTEEELNFLLGMDEHEKAIS